jgi:hypothetical protein
VIAAVENETRGREVAGRKPPLRPRHALLLLLWVWGPSALVVTGLLMASHLLALPRPATRDPRLAAALGALRGKQGNWLAVHALYAECRCSQRLVAHLASRPQLAGVTEVVLMAGSDGRLAARLRGAGYRVEVIEPVELQRSYHITAAPLLAVLDASLQVRYLGGYTRTKQGPAPQDAEIVGSLMREQHVSELPLLGCAVSEQLKAMLDPLGITALTRLE